MIHRLAEEDDDGEDVIHLVPVEESVTSGISYGSNDHSEDDFDGPSVNDDCLHDQKGTGKRTRRPLFPLPSSSLLISPERHQQHLSTSTSAASSAACSGHFTSSRRRDIKGNKHKSDKRFVTKMALLSTACTAALLFILAVSFSDWRVMPNEDTQPPFQNRIDEDGEDRRLAKARIISTGRHWQKINRRRRRFLEQQGDSNVDPIDYSTYRCDEIFINTPPPSSSSTSSFGYDKRCQYASTCNGGSGLLLPFVFCLTPHQPTREYTSTFERVANMISLSTTSWLLILSPLLLLQLTLLFRLLGSSADDYFTPSLSMFSNQLGLPPRFAGVTLLALGNGACDISATMNAIASDNKYGYQMSLGGLMGGGMFVITVVAGCVILTNGGVVCRGALVRDVMALGVTVTVVASTLERGVVTAGTEKLFISMYVVFVLIVLVADIYHRSVMLPRIRHENAIVELERQLEAERIASQRAGDRLNALFEAECGSVGGNSATKNDIVTCASAPPRMGGAATTALSAVLAALSNYEGDDLDISDSNNSSAAVSARGNERHHHRNDRPTTTGWGIESSIEGSKAWDRPIVLGGSEGILTGKHNLRRPQPGWDGMSNSQEDGGEVHQHHSQSPYHFMMEDDSDGVESSVDRYRRLLCIKKGSLGYPAHNWIGAFHDGLQELKEHFREHWRDIMDDEESNRLERCLMICEYPMTLARKLTVSNPCEGSYCRALVALSFALSPLWLGLYLMNSFDVNVWEWKIFGVYVSLTIVIGLVILRFAPGGDGTMSPIIAVPIALYGFVIAASWIDFIADHLVALLEFLGIVARIPNYIMGLTVLAWGNSMPDLSGNVTMARKGLANMAITACFAGPVFNILVGLGCGFGVLRNATNSDVNYVHLTPSIRTGFVFCFLNCSLLLVSGLAINKGMIPSGYGYIAFVLYTAYIGTSLLLQFLL